MLLNLCIHSLLRQRMEYQRILNVEGKIPHQGNDYGQSCIKPRHQVAMVATFCVVISDDVISDDVISDDDWSSVRNLLRVTHMAPRILRWFPIFLKILCTPDHERKFLSANLYRM